MANQDKIIQIIDFTGGLNTYSPEFTVPLNQAVDLQNINLFDQGWEKRRGDTAFNSSAMVSSSTAISGMGYMKFNSGTEFLNAVAGTKFFTSSGLTGTMTDKTGALTITSGQDNIWIPVSFNDLQIWFGGAPDVPFTHDGTASNAAALAGSPPSAATVFSANNRIFALSTVANPSRIFWPILGSPSDWTGTGSGNADVSKNDGENLLFGVPIGNNYAVLFKNTSTHRMLLDSSPFPIVQIQKGTGAAGRYAWAVVDGEIFFITPTRRMRSTRDGATFTDYPVDIDNFWDTVVASRIPFIQGIYYDILKQIHWYVTTTGTTNNRCIIWDIKRKCWLRHTSGFKVNVACLMQNRRLFCGHYDGKIYEKNVASIYTDASETSPGAIDAYWQTGWLTDKGLSDIVHPRWIESVIQGQTAGTFDTSYGFDFSSNQQTESQNMVAPGDKWDAVLWGVGIWAGQTSLFRRTFVNGRGNNFQMKWRNANANEIFLFQGASIPMRPETTRKLITVP